MARVDLAIIGAGPAGMAAAQLAASKGLSVCILDEQPRAGGQIYRDVDRVTPLRGALLGKDYTEGRALTIGLGTLGITHLAGAAVWAIEEGPRLAYTMDGKGALLEARHVLLTTGALERPMPLPGWTLPGVMTAGAGQILLKQSGVMARRAVLVGSGPLLYLIAAQMVRAGTPPLAMVETQTRGDFAGALKHLGGALLGWRYLLKGLGLLLEIRQADVARHTGAHGISITGEGRAEAVQFTAGGKTHSIACDTVFLHHGVVPNTQAARSVGVPHHWDAAQHCFAPEVDSWGGTSVDYLHIAGDGAGIGGAKAAALAGRLAALDIAARLGAIETSTRETEGAPLRRAMTSELAARPFLDAAYPPLSEALSPKDKTIICRCEEVTAGDIRGYAKLGCLGPNQTKAFGRAGMGPCQGRYCGLSVTQILSAETGRSFDDTGYYRIRPPLKPVTLGELAAMDDAPEAAE